MSIEIPFRSVPGNSIEVESVLGQLWSQFRFFKELEPLFSQLLLIGQFNLDALSGSRFYPSNFSEECTKRITENADRGVVELAGDIVLERGMPSAVARVYSFFELLSLEHDPAMEHLRGYPVLVREVQRRFSSSSNGINFRRGLEIYLEGTESSYEAPIYQRVLKDSKLSDLPVSGTVPPRL